MNLKTNFVQFQLGYTLKFRSRYSLRLYEIIASYQFYDNEPYIKMFGVDELRSLLDAETYTQYRDFKRRSLSIAINEINEFSDKSITTREIKAGRKVTRIEFTISEKQGEELEAVRAAAGLPRKRKPRAKPTPAPKQEEVDLIKVENARKFLDYLRGQAAQ